MMIVQEQQRVNDSTDFRQNQSSILLPNLKTFFYEKTICCDACYGGDRFICQGSEIK